MKPALPAPDEVTLLLAVARRDETAFGERYGRFSRTMFSMMRRIVDSLAEAGEGGQKSFWPIWERAPSDRPELGSPFCRIATRARRQAIGRPRADDYYYAAAGTAPMDTVSPHGRAARVSLTATAWKKWREAAAVG